MKKLGLIGGTSWHSTVEYYRIINQRVNDHFGDNTNPPLLIYTVNQSAIHKMQIENNWKGVADLLLEAAQGLERGGADALMYCANTPHKVYEDVAGSINVPILHIADAAASAILAKGLSKVGFIGTRFTMEESFLTDRVSRHGIEVHIPKDPKQIVELHRIIHEELTFGVVKDASKEYVLEELGLLIDQGAEGVILGCTEFPLMITSDDVDVPIFSTTEEHAKVAVDFILSDENRWQ